FSIAPPSDRASHRAAKHVPAAIPTRRRRGWHALNPAMVRIHDEIRRAMVPVMKQARSLHTKAKEDDHGSFPQPARADRPLLLRRTGCGADLHPEAGARKRLVARVRGARRPRIQAVRFPRGNGAAPGDAVGTGRSGLAPALALHGGVLGRLLLRARAP